MGCKVNQYESQAIREALERAGLEEVVSPDRANLRIINTCTVTLKADRKSRNAIHAATRDKQGAKVVVTGCLVKCDSQELIETARGIDYIIPKSFFKDGICDFSRHSRAFIKVQDGCNNHCSFCKVALARGASRSRPLAEIVQEANALVNRGFQEIVLTGVCLGSYGLDLTPKLGLSSLIDKLHNIKALQRLRLSSIEPQLVSKELIELLSSSDKLCPHLHLPLQSGDQQILRLMNRQYTPESYLSLIQELKANIPQIGITTDVMVGFPGEENRHFKNTLQVLRKIIPLRVHRFVYSSRKGTAASDISLATRDWPEVQERMQELKKLCEDLQLFFHNLFINKELEVLAESIQDGQVIGYTPNYMRVNFSGSQELLNHIARVKIQEVDSLGLRGLIVSRPTAGLGLLPAKLVNSKESATLT